MTTEATATSWWCEHAWLAPGRVCERVLVTAVGPTIVDVRSNVDAPADAERLRGLVIPGLANVHSHAFHRVLRGRAQSAGDFWSWRDQMYAVAASLDPDRYLALARCVYTEMALAGITCVGEFHYLHHAPNGVPYADPNAMSAALIEAASEAGIRITLLDTCYLAGGFGEPLHGVQLRFGDRTVESWAARLESLEVTDGARKGAAVHSVRAVAREDIAGVAEVAARHGLPLHMHLSEQVAENEGCLARYGCTPTALLADAGALRCNSVAVHATHLSDADIGLLGATRAGVCLCPTTERDLADGVGRARALAAAGVPLSLGSDSHAVIDLFEEARAVELDERLVTRVRGHFSAERLLAAATADGHRALGWTDAGELRVGMRADLVAVDMESVRTAGCGTDANAAIFAAGAGDVTDVVVDGRRIVRERTHLRNPDVAGEMTKLITAALS